ncbi:MAG TPA: CPBP family glutamic-type intramembrane protease [Acidimicrobiales bacterium]|nr:CPBP family glutamic-type intramembrane protease [Acidimicrobiales bacterium]
MHDPTAAAPGAVAALEPTFVGPTQVRHWWSPAPAPELPPISAKRAYGEVLFVFSAFFLTGVIAAGLLLADRYKNVLNGASWALYVPQAVEVILQSGVAVVLVVLLCSRRGVSTADLGLRLQRRADGRFAAGATTRILAWAIFAQVAGAIPNVLLQTGHLPTSKPSAPELFFGVAASVQAGIIEEIVVLAFVVVTLRQARRPLWEITVVALVLRGSYHIYYGPGVVGILLWAALFYWIYLRTQALIPLMVTHAAWDTVGFLSQRWAAVAAVALLVAVGFWIAAPITWAVEKGDRDRAVRIGWTTGGGGAGAGAPGPWSPAGQWIPPGWHPDPSGVHHWRWWDGYQWTGHVSGP